MRGPFSMPRFPVRQNGGAPIAGCCRASSTGSVSRPGGVRTCFTRRGLWPILSAGTSGAATQVPKDRRSAEVCEPGISRAPYRLCPRNVIMRLDSVGNDTVRWLSCVRLGSRPPGAIECNRLESRPFGRQSLRSRTLLHWRRYSSNRWPERIDPRPHNRPPRGPGRSQAPSASPVS